MFKLGDSADLSVQNTEAISRLKHWETDGLLQLARTWFEYNSRSKATKIGIPCYLRWSGDGRARQSELQTNSSKSCMLVICVGCPERGWASFIWDTFNTLPGPWNLHCLLQRSQLYCSLLWLNQNQSLQHIVSGWTAALRWGQRYRWRHRQVACKLELKSCRLQTEPARWHHSSQLCYVGYRGRGSEQQQHRAVELTLNLHWISHRTFTTSSLTAGYYASKTSVSSQAVWRAFTLLEKTTHD